MGVASADLPDADFLSCISGAEEGRCARKQREGEETTSVHKHANAATGFLRATECIYRRKRDEKSLWAILSVAR